MVNVFLRNTDGESLEVVGFTNGTGGLVVSGTNIEGVNVRAEYGCSIVKERNKNDGSETTPHFLWNDLHDSHGGGVLIRDVEPGATYIVIGSPVIVPGEYSSDFGSRRYEGIITHKHPLTHAHVLSHPKTLVYIFILTPSAGVLHDELFEFFHYNGTNPRLTQRQMKEFKSNTKRRFEWDSKQLVLYQKTNLRPKKSLSRTLAAQVKKRREIPTIAKTKKVYHVILLLQL